MGSLQLSLGSLFANRFEVERAAGKGGMGAVYRARDRYTGDTVALKLLHSSPSSDKGGGHDVGDRFVREAQILAELRHPGIVSYVAHGQTPSGQRYLAMEWLQGEDLAQRLQRGWLTLPECLLLVDSVASALSLAHGGGIIHRDIKPTNLFLVDGEIARVKILDFGIARRIAGSQAMTRTGMVIGTPEYMAPEQARGARAVGPAADLFSLGCVLYECLTGQPPFIADHVAAVLVRILFEDPAPIEEFRPSVPPQLVALLARLLVKDPAQRMADAAMLRSELAALGELPESTAAVIVAPRRAAPLSFAENEQSLFSVVLASLPESEAGLQATLSEGESARTTDDAALLQALQGLGVFADFLASGALVVSVAPTGSATDQVTRAARAALLIADRWPAALISMATGRGMIHGRIAVGEVVELAARSLKTASAQAATSRSPGILIDTLSSRLLAGRFQQTPRPGGMVLLGEERDEDASRPLLGKPTPCVGREAELGILEVQFRACVEESEARVAVIIAPPGVGKSRLRHEFLRRVQQRSEPSTIILGRGDLTSAGTPYGILGQAVRRLCELSIGAAKQVQQELLRARIRRHVAAQEHERIAMFVGEFGGVPFTDARDPLLMSARRDPRIMQDCVRQSFVDWLRAECQAAPVLIVLDDLQWGDALSIALVDEALRELREAPLFVLALGRPELPECFPRLWHAHRPQELPLKALSKKAGERLVQHVLGKQVSPAVMSRIVEQSSGNALLLEELIRSVTEGTTEGAAETILAMLQARIARLGSGARRAVLAASVYGETFWQEGVARLLAPALTPADVELALRTLSDQEFIQPHSRSHLSDHREYGFRHALVREAGYALLTDSDRQAGHQHAGQFLEEAGERDWAMIAEHFERGGDHEKASAYYLRAGEGATGLCAYVNARKYFTGALAALKLLPPTNQVMRQRIDTLVKQVRAAHIAEPPQQNYERLEEASFLLKSLAADSETREDGIRLAWVYYWRGRLDYYCDQPQESLRSHEQVLDIAKGGVHKELFTLASSASGTALYSQGRVELALPLVVSTIDAYAEMDHRYEWVRSVGHKGLCMVGMGLYEQGMVELDRAHARARAIDQPIIVAMTHMYYALSAMHSGDWSAMLTRSQQCRDAAAQSNEKIYQFIAIGYIAWALNQLSRPDEALEHYLRLEQIKQEMGGRLLFMLLFDAVHAEILLSSGRYQESIERAAGVIEAARTADNCNAWGIAERVQGVAKHRRAIASASEVNRHLEASIQAFLSGGLVLDAARTRLRWGVICRERGELTRARALLEDGVEKFVAAGCAYSMDWARQLAEQG